VELCLYPPPPPPYAVMAWTGAALHYLWLSPGVPGGTEESQANIRPDVWSCVEPKLLRVDGSLGGELERGRYPHKCQAFQPSRAASVATALDP
jgi:hypothetical protein